MTEWISVKDRMPGTRAAVLVIMKGAIIPCVCKQDWNGDWWFIGQYRTQRCRAEVTHWMPLPEPPEEDENDRTELFLAQHGNDAPIPADNSNSVEWRKWNHLWG